MGFANGHDFQEVGVASGWNLWVRVWLECIGVVSGCCCKEVYRYPHNNYYFPLLHSLFLAASSLFLCSFVKCFFILMIYMWVEIKA